jgi:hypothetical protein
LYDAIIDQALAWRILAFFEEFQFEAPDLVKTHTKDIIFMRKRAPNLPDDNLEFWKARKVIEWASKEDSALLILQGTPGYLDPIEKACLDLVNYLEDNKRQVFWIFRTPYYHGSFKRTADSILKNIVIQVVKGDVAFNSLRRLVTVVGLMKKASSTDEWFDILEFVLGGLNEAYVIVDLGAMRADLGLVMSWPTSFARLFRALRQRSPKTILKVFLTVCRRLPEGTDLSEALVVPVNKASFPIVTVQELSADHTSEIQLPLLQLPPEFAREVKANTPEIEELDVQERLVIEKVATKASKM